MMKHLLEQQEMILLLGELVPIYAMMNFMVMLEMIQSITQLEVKAGWKLVTEMIPLQVEIPRIEYMEIKGTTP